MHSGNEGAVEKLHFGERAKQAHADLESLIANEERDVGRAKKVLSELFS